MTQKTVLTSAAALMLLAAVVIGIMIAGRPAGEKEATSPPELPHDPAAPAADISEAPLDERPASGTPLQAVPVLHQAPSFSLTDQDGAAFGSHQLVGKAWVAGFVDPGVAGHFAALVSQFARIQQALRDELRSDVRLVGVLLDSEPGELAGPPEAELDPRLFKVLAAAASETRPLKESLLAAAPPEPAADAGSADDSGSPLVLVDPQGHVRGYYVVGSDDSVDRLVRDLNVVLQERELLFADLLEPDWMEVRRQAQLATTGQFEVFHDFSFTDKVEESGITFRNRIVDDAGRNWKPAHYDHGNGMAVADIDGDHLLDVYFVTQAGRNELWRNLGGGKFQDVTDSTLAMAERVGVTASFADIDNDGDADLYVTNVRSGNVLLENDGTGKFRDISAASGLGYQGHSSSAVFFDYNRDGLLDLFLVNVGRYTTEETATVVNDAFTGPDTAQYRYYVANPDAFAAHLKPPRSERSILFENQGDRRFVDVSEKVRLLDESWSGDASPLDFNQDGWPDLYVLNMQGHDEYYENVQGTRFVNRRQEVFPATPWGAMGIKVFDFDNDGQMDIYITDMHTDMALDLGALDDETAKVPKDEFEETLLNTDGNHVWGNAFFHNQGGGKFQEISDDIGAENYWPWGLSVGDLNADGYQDAFVTASMNFRFRYAVNKLLLNNRGQRFLDSEFILGVEPRRHGRTAIPWFELDADGADRSHEIVRALHARGRNLARFVLWGALGSRSSAIFDLDNDGDLDIVTNDSNSEPMVLVSDLTDRAAALHYLKVKLIGSKSNRDGLGAIVRLRCGDRTYTQVHDGQSGYLSQSRMPLYFGLGEAAEVDEIAVQWPSGAEQVVPGPIGIDQLLEVSEP